VCLIVGFGLVWFDWVQLVLVRSGSLRFGLVCVGLVLFSLVWLVLVQSGLVRSVVV